MKIKKMERDCWCSACDEQYAAYEITNEGSFKLFWAAGPHDPELCLCKRCFNELKQLINEIE